MSATAVLLFAIVVPSSVAQADAQVLVSVQTATGEAPNGRLVLEPSAGGSVSSCEVRQGSCTIELEGGQYSARFEPEHGIAWTRQPVVIPPSGSVQLTVNEPSR
ncbi:MAG: hypothetical protein AAF550_05530 [Myxococcota bacterium]